MSNAPLQRRRRQCAGRSATAALLCAAILCAGAMAPTTPAAAQSLQLAQASNGISLAEAARMVSERTGGQVLRAETKRDKGRTVHRIRVLTDDGRVRTWHVDAETGRIY